MRLLRWSALLLVLLLRGGCAGASSHSLRYFYTAVSEPGPGLPRFVSAGFVDGQLMIRYDSDSRTARPGAPWMERAGQEDPQYWRRDTQIDQGTEAVFRAGLETLRGRYNQSAGLHTMQLMYGCDLSEDRPGGGLYQYGYDGREFLALDTDTLTWTAADAGAGVTKRRWEAEGEAQRYKAYLEETCVPWLRRYLRYGEQTLLRTVPPVGKVTRKDSHEGLETLTCRAHGFYPKEIDVTWRKDGEVRQEDTFHGVVSPYDDGTYYTWLSIEVDPKERHRYQCHVEHDGLQDPLDLNVEESGSVWPIVVGLVSVILLVLAVAAAGIICVKKRREKPSYRPTSTSDQGSDSSVRASPPPGV